MQLRVLDAKRYVQNVSTAVKAVLTKSQLNYVGMDTLDPYQMTKYGNQFVVVMTTRYAKLANQIPTKTLRNAG